MEEKIFSHVCALRICYDVFLSVLKIIIIATRHLNFEDSSDSWNVGYDKKENFECFVLQGNIIIVKLLIKTDWISIIIDLLCGMENFISECNGKRN